MFMSFRQTGSLVRSRKKKAFDADEKSAVEATLHRTEVRADVRRLHIGCWVALIAVAIVRAWFTRYELYCGDSLAYLDIARKVAEGNPGAAIHAYWSPGYPVLVSLCLSVIRPDIYWEFPFVHFVNVFIFIGTLASFFFFWDEVILWHERIVRTREARMPPGAFWAIGYATFCVATLNVIRVGLIGPDLLVAAFACLAGWGTLRFRRAPGIWHALLLGVILALGYYAKTPFFPMGFVFVLCACFRLPVTRRAVLLGGLALAMFLLICAPFVIAISLSKGRLTFGDSARISQAFFINGVQHYQHWQGGPSGSGTPVHPTRKLSEYPESYGFAEKNMGTYPAWFDPTYWYEGITPHFDPRPQAMVLIRNLAVEYQTILEAGAEIVCVMITLLMVCHVRGRWTENLRRTWFIWIPGVSALVMFALVHVEQRFLGGWLVLLVAGIVCACKLPPEPGMRKAVWYICVAALITAGMSVLLQTSREAVGIDHAEGRSSHDAAIAEFLLSNGLHPGDSVALIGDGSFAYWAHLARLHVVAEMPTRVVLSYPALDFWESDAEEQQRALAIFERTGATAVIAGWQDSLAGSVPSIVPPPWKRIGRTGAYVYFFPVNR
jgi:hypothetical protein